MLKDVRLIEKEKEVETVHLRIDEQPVEAPKGMNLVEAAKRIGIDIPVFCYHPQLSVIGACRMCLVEIEGQPKLRTACTTDVEEGMSVHTKSPAAKEGQRSTLEFLLINHPLDCPVCDKGGECPLQDLTYDFGPGKSRFREPKWTFKKPIEIGRWILLDRERCIMCMRCTRFCEEIAWHPELILAGTTTGIQIATAEGLPFNSQFSGNTVDICPVGALLSKQYYLAARPWEIHPVDSICSTCSVGCNVTLHTREGAIKRMISRGQLPRKRPEIVKKFTAVELDDLRIKSTPLEMVPRGNPQIDDGWLCDKGRFGFVYVHENRLETPLERKGSGLSPIPWDKAIETIAQRLKQAKERGGPQSIAALGSPRVSNEANYLLQKFFRTVLGTHHIDHHPRSEWGAIEKSFSERVEAVLGQSEYQREWGLVEKRLEPIWNDQRVRFAIADIDEADTLMLIGSNISEEQPVIELRVKKALRLFHPRLVMAHPWEVELSPHADPWLRYLPGESLALLRGMLGHLHHHEGEKRERARQAGVSAEEITQMAEAYAGAKNLVILLGPEVTNGLKFNQFIEDFRAFISLRGKEGEWTSIGMLQNACNSQGAADMGLYPDLFPGYQPVTDLHTRGRLARIWNAPLPSEVGWTTRLMLHAALEGKLQALYMMGTHLITDKEIGGIAAEALPKIPFLVAQDISLTETAKLAHLVLPMASWAETDGSYTNTDRHIQRIRKAIPFAGESRTDWKTFRDLGRHLGYLLEYGRPEEIWDEIAQVAPLVRTTKEGAVIREEGQWGR